MRVSLHRLRRTPGERRERMAGPLARARAGRAPISGKHVQDDRCTVEPNGPRASKRRLARWRAPGRARAPGRVVAVALLAVLAGLAAPRVHAQDIHVSTIDQPPLPSDGYGDVGAVSPTQHTMHLEKFTSPESSPTFVARASRCRCDKAHGPKDAEGVVDTTSKRLEGVRLVTASRLASAAESW